MIRYWAVSVVQLFPDLFSASFTCLPQRLQRVEITADAALFRQHLKGAETALEFRGGPA